MDKKVNALTLLTSKNNGQKGFTLIELIMVIVLLGILAAVAVPKYQNLKADAGEAAANGMYAGARAACAINFANNMVHTGGTMITTGATLLGAMDDPPNEWDEPATPTTPPTIVGSVAGTTYTITISTIETSSAKAALGKSW